MDKQDSKIMTAAADAFKKFPAMSKLYVDAKGNLHFAPSAKPKQTVITRAESDKYIANKNTSK